jgi:hypothetical protein
MAFNNLLEHHNFNILHSKAYYPTLEVEMQSTFRIQLFLLLVLTAMATTMAVKNRKHENAFGGLEFGRIANMDKDIADNEV